MHQAKNNELLTNWRKIVYESDMKSFDQFFNLLQGRLIRFCMMYVNNREVAEEIVSDVFVDCWVNRAEMQKVENPEFYLFKVVKNKSLNELKKGAHMQVVGLDEVENDLVHLYRPDTDFEKKEMMLNLERAIQSLPPQTREVFRLTKEYGLKGNDVAAILDISLRTVQNHVYRAMCRLSEEMENYVKDEQNGKVINFIITASSFILFTLYLLPY